jgi:small subunit ribosomal protein S3Ae
MAERMRDLELKEKAREEQRKSQEESKKRERPEAGKGAKKWKGKDWFAIFSPRAFGERVIGETPATNPKTLMGRNIKVGLPELLGQPGNEFSRVSLLIDRIDNNVAYTRFNGYSTLKEHIMRVVRKRTQKVESIMHVDTKDKWKLQVSSVAILNRNTETAVKKKVRAHMEGLLKRMASEANTDELVRNIINTKLQRTIKKSATKIYPVRFFEISKIEVHQVPKVN